MHTLTALKHLRPLSTLALVAALALLASCHRTPPAPDPATLPPVAVAPAQVPVVFVVAMENHDAGDIYGNRTDAPYLNDTLMARYAHAHNFVDALPSEIPSEPHYIVMEAGTHAFADSTFATNGDPSARNSTTATQHLVTQIRQAGRGLDWMSYQEGLSPLAGACPVHSAGNYDAKHNPFVFFQDIAGSPPASDTPYCAAHHRGLDQLDADLAAGRVAAYNFITPDHCHNMHGGKGCSDANGVRAGDRWLKERLPSLIDYVERRHGIIFVVWDEGDHTDQVPLLAIGPGVRAGHAGTVRYTHASLLRTVETLFGLDVLPAAAASNDLRDLFQDGRLP